MFSAFCDGTATARLRFLCCVGGGFDHLSAAKQVAVDAFYAQKMDLTMHDWP